MGASFGYVGVDSLDMSWLPLSGRCRGFSSERWVLQCMGEGEANGGGDLAWLWGQWGSDRTGGCAAWCLLNTLNNCTAQTLLNFT
jgi:hypothetical protein